MQLILTYILVELSHIEYEAALIVAVMAASIGNFLLNKKLTFKEKIWGVFEPNIENISSRLKRLS